MRVLALSLLVLMGCQAQPLEPLKEASFTVEAELLEVKEGIPKRLNYKYVFIMKYRVLDGDIEKGTEIYVGHPNPAVSKFREGDTHQLALEADLSTIYEGGVVNRYFGEDIPSPYLAVDMR